MANGSVNPVVNIGSADTSVVDGDEDIVGRGQRGLGALSEGNIVRPVENEGKVLKLFSVCLRKSCVYALTLRSSLLGAAILSVRAVEERWISGDVNATEGQWRGVTENDFRIS